MQPHEEPENDVDFALEVLGKATPPEGMTERVTRHARSVKAPREQQRRLTPTLAVFANVACAVALVAFWTKHRDHEPTYIVQSIGAVPDTTFAARPRSHNPQTAPHAIPNASPKPHTAWLGPGRRTRTEEQITRAALPLSDDASDAPSQPAPPLPLTRQEKLLLAAAHGESSQPQIAHLRRPVWPLRDPGDDEDFARFFDPPTQLATNSGENE